MIDRTELNAYVDGELESPRRAEIEQLVRQNVSLANEISSLQEMKARLSKHSLEIDTSKSWAACRVRLNEIDRTKRVETLVGRYAPALCGILFLTIVVGGMVSKPHDASSTLANYGAMFDKHVFSHSKTDPAKLHWLKRLIDQSRISTPSQFEQRRIDQYEMDGVKFERVEARDEQGALAVYIFPIRVQFEGFKPMPEFPGYSLGTFGGQNCVIGRVGRNTVLVNANRPFADLARLLARVTVNARNTPLP